MRNLCSDFQAQWHNVSQGPTNWWAYCKLSYTIPQTHPTICEYSYALSNSYGFVRKGALVNRGDSVKRRSRRRAAGTHSGGVSRSASECRRIRSTSTSTTALTAQRSSPDDGLPTGDETPVEAEDTRGDATVTEAVNPAAGRPVKVLVMGEEGVGKTALLQQFMTSEYMAAVQTNFG